MIYLMILAGIIYIASCIVVAAFFRGAEKLRRRGGS